MKKVFKNKSPHIQLLFLKTKPKNHLKCGGIHSVKAYKNNQAISQPNIGNCCRIKYHYQTDKMRTPKKKSSSLHLNHNNNNNNQQTNDNTRERKNFNWIYCTAGKRTDGKRKEKRCHAGSVRVFNQCLWLPTTVSGEVFSFLFSVLFSFSFSFILGLMLSLAKCIYILFGLHFFFFFL